METMTIGNRYKLKKKIIAQLRRDGNYDYKQNFPLQETDHSTTKTGWKL